MAYERVLRWLRQSPSIHDLRVVGEVTVVVVATWLLLGWFVSRPVTGSDGYYIVLPYLESSRAAGGVWTEHIYRFGVLGGSNMHAIGGTLPLVELCGRL